MRARRTVHVPYRTLSAQLAASGIVARLAMCANDIAFANICLGACKASMLPIPDDNRIAAGQYFVRLQISHLREGLKTLHYVEREPSLRRLLLSCTVAAREEFDELRRCRKGGEHYEDFKRYVAMVRDKTTFHYDPGLTNRGIEYRSAANGVTSSSVAKDLRDFRIPFGDDVRDAIVCRLAWAIPADANLRTEADRISERIAAWCMHYANFAGEFCFRYFQTLAK